MTPRRCTDPKAIAKRPAHALNDRLVVLRDGATSSIVRTPGATLSGESGRQGYVWGVVGEDAMVHFGTTESGLDLLVRAKAADLVEV